MISYKSRAHEEWHQIELTNAPCARPFGVINGALFGQATNTVYHWTDNIRMGNVYGHLHGHMANKISRDR